MNKLFNRGTIQVKWDHGGALCGVPERPCYSRVARDKVVGHSHDDCIVMATTLQSLGGPGCTTSTKCDKCQGDCNRDSDCKAGLKCFQRNSASQVVPGCDVGGGGDVSTTDYCYELPTTPVTSTLAPKVIATTMLYRVYIYIYCLLSLPPPIPNSKI